MIDFLEYVAILNLVLRGKLEHKLKWSFKVYDTNRNGFLDKAELRKMVKCVYNVKQGWARNMDTQMSTPEEVCNRIFQLMDENNDEQDSTLQNTCSEARMSNSKSSEEQISCLVEHQECHRHIFTNKCRKISLKEFVDGVQRDEWVRKMLNIDPTEWILEHQRKKNADEKDQTLEEKDMSSDLP
ncbi:guanylyl cyclase-activating protein 2-like isoform X3 [Podarcis raffonei]|nr:guanylyl cyclase-activating protein 2-like isoform X3 [Podarcis raffonei]